MPQPVTRPSGRSWRPGRAETSAEGLISRLDWGRAGGPGVRAELPRYRSTMAEKTRRGRAAPRNRRDRSKAERLPTQPIVSPDQAPFVGRAAERAALQAMLHDATPGPLRVALIEGEPGIGKSRLLFESLTEARSLGFGVFYGRCEALESARPFAPLPEAFACHGRSDDPVRREIARLLAGPPEAPPPSSEDREVVRFRLVEAFVDLVESLAVGSPLALAVDDLQWADPTTIVVLRATARRLTHLPIAILATMRSVPRSSELEQALDAFAHDGALSITLQPLEPDHVGELVEACVGASPGRDLLSQVAGAAGNPLFITELIRALDEENAIDRAGERAELRSVSLPPTLRLTILRRISFLGNEVLAALRAASILGTSFALSEVAALLGRPVEGLISDLSPAMDSGIVASRDDRIVFRHDLIREAIHNDLPPAVRGAMHLEAAKRLEELRAPPDRIAQHLLMGATGADDTTLDMVLRIAGSVRRQSAALGVALYDHALGMLPEDDPRRDKIFIEAIWPMLMIGRIEEVISRVRAVLTRDHDPLLEPALLEGYWFALNRQGRWREELEDRLARTPALSLSPQQRRQFELSIATNLLFTGDAAAAAELADRIAGEALEANDRSVAHSALATTSWARCALGFVEPAVVAADEAVRIWEASGPLDRTQHAHFYRALVYVEADRFEEVDADLDTGTRHYRARDPGSMPVYQWVSAGKRFFAGEWDDAIAEAEAGFRLIEDGTGAPFASLFGHGFLGQIALRRGEIDSAEGHVANGETEVEARGPSIGIDLLWWTRALLLEARGDLEAAYAAQEFAWEATASIRYFLTWRLVAPDLVRLALASGDMERAREATESAEEGARRAGGIPSADGAALRCRALLERNAGMMVRAAEVYRGSPRRLERALVCEQAAELLGETGDLPTARKLISEALELYEGFGATRDADRTAAEMRRLGLRRGARITRRRPTSGWDSLTPTELRVIDLTVEGLTNAQVADRLYISKHTVRSHLLHVFTKLGIASRVELANLASRQRRRE